jgi:hypothetical protein
MKQDQHYNRLILLYADAGQRDAGRFDAGRFDAGQPASRQEVKRGLGFIDMIDID